MTSTEIKHRTCPWRVAKCTKFTVLTQTVQTKLNSCTKSMIHIWITSTAIQSKSIRRTKYLICSKINSQCLIKSNSISSTLKHAMVVRFIRAHHVCLIRVHASKNRVVPSLLREFTRMLGQQAHSGLEIWREVLALSIIKDYIAIWLGSQLRLSPSLNTCTLSILCHKRKLHLKLFRPHNHMWNTCPASNKSNSRKSGILMTSNGSQYRL